MDPEAWNYLANSTRSALAAHQLDQLTTSLCEIEQTNLVGVYLHGSLAMQCFMPGRSDIDILVLLAHPPAPARRRRWAELLLHVSGAPAPIEISFLHHDQYKPWRYPSPYDFHFSEEWRANTQDQLAVNGDALWTGADGVDADLAAHFMVTRRRGVCLYGQPLDTALPHVPWAHYWDSITRDIGWAYERAADNPVYLVLNCCRVWAAAAEQLVLSKAEGAAWALPQLPAAPAATVAQAAALYKGESRSEDDATQNIVCVRETARWICAQMKLVLGE